MERAEEVRVLLGGGSGQEIWAGMLGDKVRCGGGDRESHECS